MSLEYNPVLEKVIDLRKCNYQVNEYTNFLELRDSSSSVKSYINQQGHYHDVDDIPDVDWNFTDEEGHYHQWIKEDDEYVISDCVEILELATVKYYCELCDAEIIPRFLKPSRYLQPGTDIHIDTGDISYINLHAGDEVFLLNGNFKINQQSKVLITKTNINLVESNIIIECKVIN